MSRTLVVAGLALVLLVGFGLRVAQLGAEGLSEDELNKLQAVEDYRAHGLTAANGEHPMLMKALLTASVVAAEQWNQTSLVANNPSLHVSTEAALRFPAALFGAFISLLIYLLATEIFGVEVGLIAAALWALDPSGIGFNRIAKEDTFFAFFFLLANYFWLRSQRVAESGSGRPEPYYWATAASFGAMLASKYLPHFFGISVSYYWIFQGIKSTRWRLGKGRWLMFFAVMGAAFLICNPTILLPQTWHEMRVFAGEKRIGHDAYEFMGALYRNQVTLWLKGSPWYFYYVFMAFKMAVPVVLSFLVGLPLLFRKRLGDGRFLILFWMLFWFMPFTVMGGKFTRYFTMALPVVLITAAVGISFMGQLLARAVARFSDSEALKNYARAALALLVLAFPAYASISVAPHYRLYTNALGGGWERAGSYFPHDEFYDSSIRDGVREIVALAPSGARVASETPGLIAHYARLAGREDLQTLSLSDKKSMAEIREGDYVIIARGRRYFSNDAIVSQLETTATPVLSVSLGRIPALSVYVLDASQLAAIAPLIK
ncbi:MAG: Dolichyl-phosphate-mannose-protein mannosyltransferase [Blastocatellia bacterium]|nr:Dolichyl-phosphate-mannose-protein mannosyltransferase [Blastocatellia bacterium]